MSDKGFTSFSLEDDGKDPQDLVRMAQAKLDAGKPAEAPAPRRRKPAPAPAEEAASPAPADADKPSPPRRRRPAAAAAVAAEPSPPSAAAPSRGLGTLAWGMLLVAAAVLLVTLSVWSWRGEQDVPPLAAVVFNDVAAPKPLKNRWVSSFPEVRRLFRAADDEVLSAFAQHLERQTSIRRVRSVCLRWRRTAEGGSERVVAVDLETRTPVMPVLLSTDLRAWVDAEGVVVSGQLPGPEGEPELLHLERGGQAALAEVLAFWPRLRSELPANFIAAIDLHGPLDRPGQNGIVLHTAQGGRILWGAPGEERFGVRRDDRIRNLLHAVRHLDRVRDIVVRFDQPHAVVARTE